MTDYELLDLRSSYLDEVHRLFTFWVSTTFALVATAYFVGAELGVGISAGIAALYLFLTIGNSIATRQNSMVVVGLTQDLAASMAVSDAPSHAVAAAAPSASSKLPGAVPLIQALGTLGAISYLFYRTGGG